MQKLKNGVVEGVNFSDKCDISKNSCTVCCEGKQTRLPFPHSANKSSGVLELVHTDLCGPMENLSLGKAKYFLLFVDDFSRMCTVYFLREKNETFKYFKQYKELVETQQSKIIKILRSNNGGEFCSAEIENYLRQCGIVHQKTNSYTPEQNGLCERYNRSIVEKARCLLFDAQFQKCLWAEAVNTAVYIINCAPAAGIGDNTTPYEIWTGRKPKLDHLRIFGSPVMVHIRKEKRRKWDKKAKKMFLVGYSENVKGYRLCDPVARDVTIARDVVVMENIDDSSMTTITVNESRPPEDVKEEEVSLSEEQDISESQKDKTFIPSNSSSDTDDSYSDTLSPEDLDILSTQCDTNVPEKRVRRKPDFYNVVNMCAEISGEQLTISDVLNSSEKEQWQCAIKDELKSFSENDTWELVDRPKDKNSGQSQVGV
ncbi:unnamed protein product [Euphydryas editha]|uniref:Integrase catalytic domain-containing protein n=1 Tax=Euphydryas editha TaxID=104508 RepID=A0AAU9TQK5_EUPED|nr:unnamed protein product [Euphydryas editha]